MGNNKAIRLQSFFLLSLFLMLISCSNRLETPIIEDDLTITFPPKKTDDISVRITLGRKLDKKTDDLLGKGTVFTLRENANLRAFVDIENRFYYGDKKLMFHFDWIGPDGETFYMKQVYLSQQDSTSTISSSISISPEQRDTGEYKLRVYLFRELIAEKKFEVLPEFQLKTAQHEELKVNIMLYRTKSKKSGKLIGEGSSFKIKSKAKVRALVEIENRFAYGDQELALRFDWMGPDGESFYGKQFDLFPGDSTQVYKSSISIPPNKREPGNYSFHIYLYDNLIGQKDFELIP